MTKFHDSETLLLIWAFVELGAKSGLIGDDGLVRVRCPLHDDSSDSALILQVKVEANLARELDTPQLEFGSAVRVVDLDDAEGEFARPYREVKDEGVLTCRVEAWRGWKVTRDGMQTGMVNDVAGRQGNVVVALSLWYLESRSEQRVREDGDTVGQAQEYASRVGYELASHMSMGMASVNRIDDVLGVGRFHHASST